MYDAEGSTVVWRKSSASGAGGCVEVGFASRSILVRDTKDRAGAVLSFSKPTWADFIAAVRSGQFDFK